MPEIMRLSGTPAALGESPVWDDICDCLWWIDGVAGVIHRTAPGAHWQIGGHIGGVALAEGGLIVARDHEVCLFDSETGSVRTLLTLPDANPKMRLNDVKLDRQGRLICAGMGRAGDPLGLLHQLDGALRHRSFGPALKIGNGVCFSPEGDVLYFSDTVSRLFYACDYDPDTGRAGSPRVHVDTGALGAGVDGATVDRDGVIWATFIHTGEIACLSPEGRLTDRFRAPVDLPSSLAFGGPDMTTLYVTSIRDSGTGRAVSEHPEGGHVFAIDGTGATGLPEARFALAEADK